MPPQPGWCESERGLHRSSLTQADCISPQNQAWHSQLAQVYFLQCFASPCELLSHASGHPAKGSFYHLTSHLLKWDCKLAWECIFLSNEQWCSLRIKGQSWTQKARTLNYVQNVFCWIRWHAHKYQTEIWKPHSTAFQKSYSAFSRICLKHWAQTRKETLLILQKTLGRVGDLAQW